MDFQLSDEQLQLKKMVREFAEREIAPNVMKWDEASEFPLATIKELGKLGLLGMIFPAEYGGSGMGYVDYITAVEELSRVDGSVGITVAAHTSLCSNHVFLAGIDDVRGAERPGDFELGIEQIDGDNRMRVHEAGALDDIEPHAADRRIPRSMGSHRARLWIRCWWRSVYRRPPR